VAPVLAACAARLFAQPPDANAPPALFRAETSMVTVAFQVVRHDRAAFDLGPQDIQVREDGAPHPAACSSVPSFPRSESLTQQCYCADTNLTLIRPWSYVMWPLSSSCWASIFWFP
jgi:hypothetical protein